MAPRPKVKPNPLDAKWVVLGREEKLVQLMKENGWEIADETSIPKMVLTTKGKDAKNLAKEYGRLWESMNKFFCFIGDYRSAILVNRTVCSTTPPPLDPVSVCAYISYMCNVPGSTVLHPKLGTPILDRRGTVVLARGTWKSPNSVYKVASAIKAVHNLYRHLRVEIPYSAKCDKCFQLNLDNKSSIVEGQYLACISCQNAFGHGCTETSGCVMSDPLVSTHFKGARSKLGETHKVKGNVQLTPGEIRQCRGKLLTANATREVWLENLKFYTMMLLGIALFLRSDELLNIRMSQFLSDLTMVRDIYGVRALVLTIKGKSDPFPLPFILWANDEYPELCPVRHLLVYIALSGVQEGFLFGHPYVYKTHNTEAYPYEEFLFNLKSLCVDFLKRPDHGNIYGTHVLRKTGYLFAIFGFLKRFEPEHDATTNKSYLPKITLASIMKCARHAAICNAATYMRDSLTLYEWAKQAQVMDVHDVGIFKDIHVEDSEPFRAILGEECRTFQKSTSGVAQWYVRTYLRLKLDSHLSVQSCLQVACGKNSTAKAEEQLRGLIESLSAEDQEVARKCVSKIKSDSFCFGQASLEISESTGTDDGTGSFFTPTTYFKKRKSLPGDTYFDHSQTDLSEMPGKRQKGGRKFGNNNLEVRMMKNWSKLDTTEKRVESLVAISTSLKNTDLTQAACTFYYSWAKPVATCVEKCHLGCIQSFTAAHPSIRDDTKVKKFSCSQCGSK
jgi:hypothetical protein